MSKFYIQITNLNLSKISYTTNMCKNKKKFQTNRKPSILQLKQILHYIILDHKLKSIR